MNLDCPECIRLWSAYAVALRENKGGEAAAFSAIREHETRHHPERQWNQPKGRDVLDR
jgi:hypothetical protein